jgi:ribonuclease III
VGKGGLLERLSRRWRQEPAADDPAVRLQARLGYRFRRRELLDLALTHRSYANERGLAGNYERLEFLGDSVLGVLAAEWLFREYPEEAEGRLSALKSALVSGPALARRAAELGIGSALRLGVGEDRSGGRDKSSLLADALEAVLGAVFLDRGLDAARRIAEPLLGDSLSEIEEIADAKTRLQEMAQARGLGLPVYRLLAESGPDHRKRFTAECVLGAHRGIGEGGTKKRAEQRAAGVVAEALQAE